MISMKTIFHFTLIIVYSWNSIVNAEETTIYKYEVTNTKGIIVKMENFKGKVLIFVNVPTMYSDTVDSRNLMNLAKEFSKAEVQFFAFIYGVPIIQYTNSNGSTFKDFINKANNENTCKIELFENYIINGNEAHELWIYMKMKHLYPAKINSYEMFIVSKYGYVVDRVPATEEYQDIKDKIMLNIKMWKNRESVYDFYVTKINNNNNKESKSMIGYKGDVLVVFKLNFKTTTTKINNNKYTKFVNLAKKKNSNNIKVLVFLFGMLPAEDFDKINKIKNTFNVFWVDGDTSELWRHMLIKTSSEELIPEYTAFIINGNGEVYKRIGAVDDIEINLLEKLARNTRSIKRKNM